MSKKIAPRVQLNFEPEVIEDEIIQEEEVNLSPQPSRKMPEVIERDEIIEKDIFDNPSLNGMGEDLIIKEESPEPQPQAKQPVKQTKQTKKKRQLSEEHKAKLALAREKALATRRAKAEEKKKMKQIENETKELKKKKAQKDLEQLKSDVDNDTNVKTTNLGSTNYPTSMFTKKDLEDAQLDAIMKYEAIRKARKEEKKKQQMIDDQKKALQKKIQGYGARDANGRLLNKWDRCY